MTVDDLMALAKKARTRAYSDGLRDNKTVTLDDVERAGVTAIVRALRDEIWTRIGCVEANDIINEILGSDAGEKVAGGSTRKDEQHGGETVTPATDFTAHLARQRAFSERTFGPGERVEGVSEHIRKELVEVAGSEPGHDRQREWIDVVMLALDGAWRSGMSPEEIIEGLRFKLDINERRTWPDWRTADPNKAIEHHRNDRAPNAAPAVCEWTRLSGGRHHVACVKYTGPVSEKWLKKMVCPECSHPIKFTEANHG